MMTIKNIFLFSWKCSNSFGVDQPCNEMISSEGHETFRTVITSFQGSGLIIITQSTSDCSSFFKVFENSCHCTEYEDFPQLKVTAAKLLFDSIFPQVIKL